MDLQCHRPLSKKPLSRTGVAAVLAEGVFRGVVGYMADTMIVDVERATLPFQTSTSD